MQQLQQSNSLYNIRAEHINLIQLIEEADGELTPEVEQALALTEEQFQEKAISYGFVVKGFEDTAGVIDNEIERLSILKERAVKRMDLFKKTLSEAMQQFGVEKIETPTLKLSFRKSESVEITDETSVPGEFVESKIVHTISKTKIKEALKAGKAVAGAVLNSKQNLQIK